MIRKVSVFVVLVLWIVLPGAKAIKSLMSVPASDGGVLTAGVGQQISLTCSHDNEVSAATRWKASAPIDCTRPITHPGAVSTDDCGPFSFVNVSSEIRAPYTSTAVANATTSMTGAVVRCFDGIGPVPVQIGSNITLCVYGQVTQVSCPDLEISWNEVIDSPACVNQVEYMVTITNISGVVATRNVSVNRFSGSNILQRGESYNVSVCSKAVGGSCSAEPATMLCEISLTPPPPTTSTSSITSQQGTNVAAIVVPIVLVVAIIVSIPVIIFIVYFFCRPGRNKSDQKASLSTHVGQGKHKAKSDKGGADNTEIPTYQDPATIQHKQAASGDLYALTDNLEKRSKNEKSEEVLADMYSVPDKSKKNQLTYAEIDTGGGSGTPVDQGPRTNYTAVKY